MPSELRCTLMSYAWQTLLMLNIFWRPMPLLIYFCFIHGWRYEYKEHTLVCFGVCVVDGLEDGWKLVCREHECCDCCGLTSVQDSNLHLSGSNGTVIYLNVRPRKLDTIIILTVHILQWKCGHRLTALGGLFQAQSKLLPINPARQ